MAAEGGNNIIVRFTYTGAEGEHIPDEATHITIADDCTFVRADAFANHQNIVEVICHEGVVKIERSAFAACPNLRRVIMPGVKEVESAFWNCTALADVECGKLEIIKEWAFNSCWSLRSIDLPSIRIVEEYAFCHCNKDLTDVKFGRNLERIEEMAFFGCTSLERITIPLKDGLIAEDDIFQGCYNLKEVVVLIEGELHEIIAALHLDEWRNDMNEEIDSINRILPKARAGHYFDDDDYAEFDLGQKARAIRRWIRSVLGRIIRLKAEHQLVLNEAAATLQLALPQDLVMNNVLPFLQLPAHTFDGEDNYSFEGEEDYSLDEGEDAVEEEEDSVEGEGHEDEEGDRVELESNSCCCCIQ